MFFADAMTKGVWPSCVQCPLEAVEMTPQVLVALDPEMAAFMATHLRAHGVQLRLSSRVETLEPRPAGRKDGAVARSASVCYNSPRAGGS